MRHTAFYQVFIGSWEVYIKHIRQKNMESTVISAFSMLVSVFNKLNRIPKLNLFNSYSHITRHIPCFRETAVMQSWMYKADSRSEPTEDLGTDLESAHVLFPVWADSIKPLPTVLSWQCAEKGGWGLDNGWRAHKMYGQPVCLLCMLLVLSIFLFFSNFHFC